MKILKHENMILFYLVFYKKLFNYGRKPIFLEKFLIDYPNINQSNFKGLKEEIDFLNYFSLF